MLTTETKRKYSAQEQCRAVLLVWSERRTPVAVCRELKISGGLLALWQERALDGLLTALEPREGARGSEQGPTLGLRVKKMLEKKTAEREGLARLHGRLARLSANSLPKAGGHNKAAAVSPPGATEG